MRWSSEISVTVSLAAGVCVVPLVTVPVMVAAEAPLAKANKAQSALNLNLILIFLQPDPCQPDGVAPDFSPGERVFKPAGTLV